LNEKYMELREVNLMYEKKFNDLKSERSKLIKKIKCLEDELLDKSLYLLLILQSLRMPMGAKDKG